MPRFRLIFILVAASVVGCAHTHTADPLPSWNETAAKTAIVSFVDAVTDPNGEDFVAREDRIAVFDNDGTLWVEYPMYTQILFAFDRVKELAPQNLDWKTQQPFKGVLEGDMEAVRASGMKGLTEIVLTTHSGMTASEFEKKVSNWLATRKQARFDRPYTECVYQPQLELLAYLRANGFTSFIVSGGGIQFMRTFTEKAFGIPHERVVGSSIVTEFQIEDGGEPVLVRKPQFAFFNDKAAKPVGIYDHIGRRPILAFGNSDSDTQMIEYTTAGDGRRLGLFIHHTDADREYAYDRESHVGALDKALDRADAMGWIIVDMKNDWKTVFPE